MATRTSTTRWYCRSTIACDNQSACISHAHHKVVCTVQQQQQQQPPEQQQPAAAAAANIPMIVVQQMHDLLDIDAIESHKDTGDQTKDQTCQREVDLTPTAKEEANNHNPACCHRLIQSPM
jgi:hypothetical protein